jgi:threonine dehydrogenase-like Zn-dependent dehydrogenase
MNPSLILSRIIGHEFSGEIVEVGEGSKGEFKLGEKVTQ